MTPSKLAVKPEKRGLKFPLLTKVAKKGELEGGADSELALKPLSTCLPALTHGPGQTGTALKVGQSSTQIDERREIKPEYMNK